MTIFLLGLLGCSGCGGGWWGWDGGVDDGQGGEQVAEVALEEGDAGADVLQHGGAVLEVVDGELEELGGLAGEVVDLLRAGEGVDALDGDPALEELLLAGEAGGAVGGGLVEEDPDGGGCR
jgi:hypothetical protein